MTKNIILTVSLLVAAALASGCGGRQPVIPAVEFGDTVRTVMESQIHDLEAAIHPNPDAVEGTDVDRLDSVLNAYREDVAAPDEVQRPLTINLGN